MSVVVIPPPTSPFAGNTITIGGIIAENVPPGSTQFDVIGGWDISVSQQAPGNGKIKAALANGDQVLQLETGDIPPHM